MPYGWEGNRRSGVALAVHHRLNWFIHIWALVLREIKLSIPPTTASMGYMIFLTFKVEIVVLVLSQSACYDEPVGVTCVLLRADVQLTEDQEGDDPQA